VIKTPTSAAPEPPPVIMVSSTVYMNYIQELLDVGESEHLEFKSGDLSLDGIGATVCAFLNSQGGTLVVGVDARGHPRPVQGGAEEKALAIRDFLQEQVSPMAPWSVEVEEYPVGEVITVDVPRGMDRPYVCRGTIFLRRGGATVPADASMVRRLVQGQYVQPTRWERLPALGVELAELSAEEIRQTVTLAQQTRNYRFRQPNVAEEVLADLGLLRQGQLTNAADVLFGRNPGPRLPQTRIRATVFAEDKGGDFIDDRVLEGCAFALLEQVFAFVQQHIRIEARFGAGKPARQGRPHYPRPPRVKPSRLRPPGQLAREDRPQYPFDALRGGLINAIIHRDYAMVSGGMAVGIYPERIEIWNSGRLPEGLEVGDLKRTHPSLPANPDMAHVFHLRGLIERIGRGTLKIVEQCKEFGLPSPEWKVAPSGITLVFRGAKQVKSLNERQKELLGRLEPGQTLKPRDYYDQMEGSVSQRQAQRDLSDLERGGWLRQEGEGPSTVYVRTELAAP
jgi:ATP-dependent DNA helicase RecG